MKMWVIQRFTGLIIYIETDTDEPFEGTYASYEVTEKASPNALKAISRFQEDFTVNPHGYYGHNLYIDEMTTNMDIIASMSKTDGYDILKQEPEEIKVPPLPDGFVT